MKLPENRRKLVMTLLLVAVLLGAFAVRAYRISDPIGGYHAFNEGFYTKIAAADTHRGLFDWLIAPLDKLNPPLYSLIVTIAFALFGQSVALARLVSVVAGVASIYYTYLLGKTLYTERIGLLAAAVLAFTPGLTIVNHNIQVDSLMLFFMVAGTYHYARSIPGDDRKQALIGGLMMGLALATKLPSALAPVVLALWETWRTRGVAWLKGKRVLPFIGGMFALGLPWYVTRLVVDGNAYLTGQAALSENAGVLDSWLVFRYQVLNELWWLMTPVIAVIAIAALGYLLYKRGAGDKLLLLSVAAYIGFYLFYNFHSYYLIPLTPFLALAVARGTYALARRVPAVTWSWAVLLPFLLLATLVLMAGNKYGRWDAEQVRASVPAPLEGATVFDTFDVSGSYQPALEYTLAPAKVVELPTDFQENPFLPSAETSRTYLLTSLEPQSSDGVAPAYVAEYFERITSVVVFGVEVGQVPPNPHFFGNGKWRINWRGAPYFGFVSTPSDTFNRLYDTAALEGFLK